jgi:hypothetical protein
MFHQLRALAKATKQVRMVRQADEAIKRLTRKARCGKTKTDGRANLVFQRALRARRDRDRAVLAKKREAAVELRATNQKLRQEEQDKKTADTLSKEAKAKLKAALDALKFHKGEAVRIDQVLLGQGMKDGGGKKQRLMRENFLERLKLRSPVLPDALEPVWEKVKKNYAKQLGFTCGKAVGKVLMAEIVGRTGVIKKLGKHYRHPKLKGEAFEAAFPRGDPQAFVAYLKHIRALYGDGPEAAEYVDI